MINLARPLAFFDLETTGLDITKERIVEISILKLFPDQSRKTLYYLVNPTIPIPKEVSAIHGITDDRVKDAPQFSQIAAEIAEFIREADLAGYNSNRFDIPMLTEEMLRCGIDLYIENKNNIDIQTIFHTKEKRDLSAAYQFYCEKELTNAHTAEADTEATYEIFKAQLLRYPDIINDVAYISKTYSMNSSGHLDNAKRILKKDNQYYLCFGKYKDMRFQDIFEKDKGYFKWMYNADFGLHTKAKLKQVCNELGISLS
jgi:DNA polymerase-3 subunit epsilon